MVTHNHKDGHPLSEINQKEVDYRLEIWHLGLSHGDICYPSPGWSTTIKVWLPIIFGMVTEHPQDTHQPFQGRSPTIQRMLINYPKDGHPYLQCWSPTIPWMVIYNPKYSQPPYEGLSLSLQRIVTFYP